MLSLLICYALVLKLSFW